MKKIFFLPALFILAAAIFISCKKETSCEACGENNKLPIAIAGPDQVITLPTDSISLDGLASNDPDGTISGWLWKKISGPASFTIIKQTDSITKIKTLVTGVYQFELKINDNGGLSAKDTVQITVNNLTQSNRPPVANAGIDQTIILPISSITVDGSSSTDADNNITSYTWTKISGPASFSIVNANSVTTQVTNLAEGLYQFELKVTDVGGLFSKDTVQIKVNPSVITLACDNSNRPQLITQLIPVGTLSQARRGMAVASAGNKILFAGGLNDNGGPSSRVDIYNFVANTWSTAELCIERYDIAATAAGNKVFFAGGEYGDGTWPVDSVDIYDVTTNTWKVSHLSIPGNDIVAAAVGNKVLFAGGDGGFSGSRLRHSRVDIYDLTTNSWSTATLSGDRMGGHRAVTVNNKVYFAGGATWPPSGGYIPGTWYISNTIDIYNNATNSWSTSALSEGKGYLAGINVRDKIYWAGGTTGGYGAGFNKSCVVEINDVINGNSSIQQLSAPADWLVHSGQNAVVRNEKIVFMGNHNPVDNKFDIYDIATNAWSIGILPVNIEGAFIISVNNTIYVAGGMVNGVLSNQVWNLEF